MYSIYNTQHIACVRIKEIDWLIGCLLNFYLINTQEIFDQ